MVRFVAESEAHVSIFDRGLLFGDGVYDVATVLNGQLLDADFHLARLGRSCAAIALTNPYTTVQNWTGMMQELLRQTGVTEGTGVSAGHARGTAERDFAFPKDTRPTAFAYARTKTLLNDPNAERACSVVTTRQTFDGRGAISRLHHCWLPYSPSNIAKEQGAFEAFMHMDGVITEGGSSNAFMVKQQHSDHAAAHQHQFLLASPVT